MVIIVRTYYDLEQTKLKEEYYEVDDKKNGEHKLYHLNGKLHEICNYIDDKINGQFKRYYSNGELWPVRIVGFVTGILGFTVLTYIHLNEGITLKTGVILTLATVIVLLQVFWKV
jgi:hypothetical protein